MQVALVQVCIDERLNHELLRIQVRHKLAEHYLQAQRILILNEIGGNLGENFRSAAQMLLRQGDKIVLAAVLHHDNCLAAKAGLRKPIEETVNQMSDFLGGLKVACVLAWGNIYSDNNYVVWLNHQQLKASLEQKKVGIQPPPGVLEPAYPKSKTPMERRDSPAQRRKKGR